MDKYTPKDVIEARKDKFVQKWRLSGRHGTFIPCPTLQELRDRSKYCSAVNNYITLLNKSILEEERRRQGEYFRCMFPDYYRDRYDLTSVECEIVRGVIKEKL